MNNSVGTKTRRTRQNKEREAIGVDSQNCKKNASSTNLSFFYKHNLYQYFSLKSQVNCLIIYLLMHQ